MNLFPNHNLPEGTGRRLTGSRRYWELAGRDFKRFFAVNLLTLLGLSPFGFGVLLSILSSSILALIPACVIGGIAAGPTLSCMHDAIFRSLRDAPGAWFENYKRAWKQNWRQSIIPGIIFCLLLGFYSFMLMTFWWASRLPSPGTIAVYVLGLVLLTMFFSLYWPQIALFEQSGKQRFQNCLLFMIRYFGKTLGCALLQLLYWTAMVLFLPWTSILLPFAGVWFILFTADFLLYPAMDEAFQIEEQITQAFPEQAPFYEDDEAWLERKQRENNILGKRF